MSRRKALLAALVLTVGLSFFPVFAATNPSVSINNQLIQYTSDSGTPFIDSAGRTQVPFRLTLEKFGASVTWSSQTRTATAVKDGITVRVPIGQTYIYRNTELIYNDTSALIKDSRTYLPIRVVLEAFGATVKWNESLSRVEILTGIQPPPATPVLVGGYFDIKDLSRGLIHVTYSDGGKIKIIIEKGTGKYTYDLNSTGQRESFPLQLGDGTYKIGLYKNISGTSYSLITSRSFDVKISNANDVYLTSIQTINWNVDSNAVAKAIELTKGTPNVADKARVLWDYMVKNNSYDYVKAANITSGYVPVVDRTLAERKGICYDFSALYAAMLRSQGTPAKLIKGYAPKYATGYHAWNEVYDASQGKWLVVDTTYDLQIYVRDKNVTMVKNSSEFSKLYEY
jgi:hypothetical protein